MKAIKKIHIIVVITPLVIACIYALLGVYFDRESGESFLFIKHKPSTKFLFISPQGEADRSYILGKEGYLTTEMEEEQMLFEEFVIKNKGYEKKIKLF